MLVRLLVSRAGPTGGNAGEEITVANAEAIRMIEAGQAVPVREQRVETTAKPRRTTRKRKP